MKLKQINLDDDGVPETVLVQMSHDEALYLALLAGRQTGDSSEGIMPGGNTHNTSAWNTLAGDLFNNYYDDGVDEAASHARKVHRPGS